MHDEWDAADRRLLEAGELEELLARYVETIQGRCAARVWNHADAEDVAQRVLYRLWNELKACRTYPVPFRVVVHKVIGWTIRAYLSEQAKLPLPDEREEPVDGEFDEVDGRLDLERLFGQLTGREREIFTGRYLQGREIEEIAAELDMTRNAVDQALHRGHRKLRELIRG